MTEQNYLNTRAKIEAEESKKGLAGAVWNMQSKAEKVTAVEKMLNAPDLMFDTVINTSLEGVFDICGNIDLIMRREKARMESELIRIESRNVETVLNLVVENDGEVSMRIVMDKLGFRPSEKWLAENNFTLVCKNEGIKRFYVGI